MDHGKSSSSEAQTNAYIQEVEQQVYRHARDVLGPSKSDQEDTANNMVVVAEAIEWVGDDGATNNGANHQTSLLYAVSLVANDDRPPSAMPPLDDDAGEGRQQQQQQQEAEESSSLALRDCSHDRRHDQDMEQPRNNDEESTDKDEVASHPVTPSTATTDRQLLFCCILSIPILVAIILVVFYGQTSNPPTTTEPLIQAVGLLTGMENRQFFGSSVAISHSGHRVAVASVGSRVEVFERSNSDDTLSEWTRLGTNIIAVEGTAADSVGKSLTLQAGGLTAVDMNDTGDWVVVGYSDAMQQRGSVQVYRLLYGNTWTPVGLALNGTAPGDLWGHAVAMNSVGNVIAIGAPGQGTVSVYQLNSDGRESSWGLRGDWISEQKDGEFGTSVALSALGDRVAVASRAFANAPDPTPVHVYEFSRYGSNEWTELGSGLGKETQTATGWYVEMSAAGSRIVVSNSYVFEQDWVNEDPSNLVVQVYDFDATTMDWVAVGDDIHAGMEGIKSGYLISLSSDGSIIAMGDPGTSEGGRTRGHMHLYEFNRSNWVQVGPNIASDADGDNFGFAIGLSGDGNYVCVGAPYNDYYADNAGQVQVYETPFAPDTAGKI